MYIPPPVLIGVFLILSISPAILPWIRRGMFTWYAAISISVAFIVQLIVDIKTLGGGGFFLPSSGTFTEAVEVLGYQVVAVMERMELWRCFTSLFVHLNTFHVLNNLIFFIIFAYALESRIGRKVTVASFYLGGLIGELLVTLAALYGVWGESPFTYGVGASGAIFGIAGALLILYPREKIFFPIIIFRKFRIVHIVGLYFLMDFLAIVVGARDNIGHVAHVGGMLGGVLLGYLIQRTGYEGEETLKPTAMSVDVGEDVKRLATDDRGLEIISLIESSQEREVIMIWLEKLGGHLRCPKCGRVGLRFQKTHFRCPECGGRVKLKRVEREVSHP